MVMPISHQVESTLTGRNRARKHWTGKLVLQVECNIDTVHGLNREPNTGKRWRDATADDFGMNYAGVALNTQQT